MMAEADDGDGDGVMRGDGVDDGLMRSRRPQREVLGEVLARMERIQKRSTTNGPAPAILHR
jgi:hypothetical protein